jgi:protein-histidine pros-kinase
MLDDYWNALCCKRDMRAAVALATFIAAVFVMDLWAPRGVGVWMLYLVPVWLTAGVSGALATPIVAGICAILTMIGLVLSPSGLAQTALMNRSIMFVMLGLTAMLVTRDKKRRRALTNEIVERTRVGEDLKTLVSTLEARVAERTRDLAASRTAALHMMKDAEEAKRKSEEAEAALHKSAHGFRALLESAPDAMVIVNGAGAITWVNGQTEQLFGYSRDALLGQAIEILVPQRFRSAHGGHRTRFFEMPQTRPMGAGLELFGLHQDGHEFPVEISLSPLHTDEGLLVTAAIRDITERKRAEAKFRGLLEAAPDAMIIVNSEGRVVLINSQAERLFGYAREELLGQAVEVLIPQRFCTVHPGHRIRYFDHPHPRAMGESLDLFARKKDGTEFPVEISLGPLETEAGTLVTAAVRDITLRAEQTHRMQEASRLKSEFLANMSHELRTPLNSIIGFTELIHDEKVGPVSAEQKEYLGDMLTSSKHLLQLINDILDLSKIESGKMDFRPERIDLSTLLNEVKEILRTFSGAKRIPISVHVAPELGEVMTDPSKLKQIMYNYLSNALKFTADGGRVFVRAIPEGVEHFRVEVQDSGIGIRPEDIDRLFVEFQQLDASAAKKYAGTGLGLALTKRIVEAQGGWVGIQSVLGEGSTFFAVLPRVATAVVDPYVPTPGISSVGRPLVLTIEDDPKDRQWLMQTLMNAGYAIETAATGAEGLLKATQQTFDAITLDLILPDMSGRDVLKAIRITGPNRHTPILLVTVVADRGVAAGFEVHDILAKPVDQEVLLASLTRAEVPPGAFGPILVVDDDPHSLRLAEKSLGLFGYQAVCVSDGDGALLAARKEAPAAVLLDLMMPGLSGFEFLQRFRSTPRGRRTPVIIWTVKDLSRDDRDNLRLLAQGVVLKTDGTAALIEELKIHVRQASNQMRGPGHAR